MHLTIFIYFFNFPTWCIAFKFLTQQGYMYIECRQTMHLPSSEEALWLCSITFWNLPRPSTLISSWGFLITKLLKWVAFTFQEQRKARYTNLILNWKLSQGSASSSEGKIMIDYYVMPLKSVPRLRHFNVSLGSWSGPRPQSGIKFKPLLEGMCVG